MQRQNRMLLLLLIAVAVLIVTISAYALWVTVRELAAVDKLNDTSSRAECRSEIVSEYTSEQWDGLWRGLDGLARNDVAQINEEIARGLQRMSIESRVSEVCPSPVAVADE